ncbi:glucose-1-phosphate thymidylyltransferase [Streptomyces sp. NPDC048266]|uniref:glucose-1-phosphate thymidylyltransferase n=1 Tax=unclassified Streptomyces TaxID=2593676 RepID=UPI0033C7E783
MKALVLSGGTGSRLRPFTYSTAKQLLPVANKPVLTHCLENIRDIGVTDVGVIVGDHVDQISAVVGDGSALGLRITYIRQDAPLGLAHCISIASDFLGDDDFVMYLGDNVLVDGIVEAADRFRTERADARILVSRVEDPRAYGVAEVGPEGRVLRLVEKPEHPASDLAVIGVYFFTAAVHRAVAAIRPSARGELEVTDAIQHLVRHGDGGVFADEYKGYWKDTGKPEDLLECNSVLLSRQSRDVRGTLDEHSVVEGAVVIEEGATIVRSRITGPVVIGAGSVITDCTVGPDVSVGRHCVLENLSVSRSILLEGGSVRGLPALHDSIIGRWSEIGASPDPGPRRLIIGDNALAEVPA